MTKVLELDPTTVSLKKLDDIKFDHAKHILEVIVKLCKQAKRKDGVSIIHHLREDLEQIFIASEEIGRRGAAHDKAPRKLPSVY